MYENTQSNSINADLAQIHDLTRRAHILDYCEIK